MVIESISTGMQTVLRELAMKTTELRYLDLRSVNALVRRGYVKKTEIFARLTESGRRFFENGFYTVN